MFLMSEVLCTGVPRSEETAPPPGTYSRTMPRVLGWSWGGVLFLMSEVPMYSMSPVLTLAAGPIGLKQTESGLLCPATY